MVVIVRVMILMVSTYRRRSRLERTLCTERPADRTAYDNDAGMPA